MGGGSSKSKNKEDTSQSVPKAPPSSDEALGLSPVIPPAAADPVPKEQAAEVSLPTTTDGSFSKAKEMSAEEAGQWKAVHSAARWGKYEEVNKMVRTSNVDLQDPINGNFTIHIAAQNGHLPVVELLIEKSATVNVQNKTGQTALHMAVEYDYYDIVLALIGAGADKKVLNNDGCEARTGIEGKKCLPFVAFSAATNATELQNALRDLLAVLDTEDKERVDKAGFVQTGMKHKKGMKEDWNSDPFINTAFMDIVRSL